MLKDKRGNMPKIKIKAELPNKYSIKPIKGEKEDAG